MAEFQTPEAIAALMIRPEAVAPHALARAELVAHMETALYKQRSPIEALKLATHREPDVLTLETKFKNIGGAFKIRTPHGGGAPVTYDEPTAGNPNYVKKLDAEAFGPYLTRVIVGGKAAFDAEPILKTRTLDTIVGVFDHLPYYSDMLNGLSSAAKREVFEKFFNSKDYLDALKTKLNSVPSQSVQSLDLEVLAATTRLRAAEAHSAGIAAGDPAKAAAELTVQTTSDELQRKTTERDTLPDKVRSILANAPHEAILDLINTKIDGIQATIGTETTTALTAIETGVRSDMERLPTIWRKPVTNPETGAREQMVDQKIMAKLVKVYIKRGSAGLFDALLDRSSVDLQRLHNFATANPDEYQKLVVQAGSRFMADYFRPVAGQAVGTETVKGYGGKLKMRAIKKIMSSSDALKTQILYTAINNVRDPGQTAQVARELGLDEMVDYMKQTTLSKMKLPEKFKKLFTTKKGLILLASALGLAGGVWYWWGPITHALGVAGSAIAGGYGTASQAVSAMGTSAGVAVDNAGRALFGTSTVLNVPGVPPITLAHQPGIIENAATATQDFVMGPGGLVDKAQAIADFIVASKPQ